jgi:hypothetical protein
VSADSAGACELDSHADTCVAGSNFILLEEPIRTVNVHAYSPELAPLRGIPVGTAATVWVDPLNGQSYLLVLNECLFFGDRLNHSLLCPNQLRCNGLIVEDIPKQFSSSSMHSIFDPISRVRIPLHLRGAISYFESHPPTSDDVANLVQIHLTSAAEWPFTAATLAEQEPPHTLSSLSQRVDINNWSPHDRLVVTCPDLIELSDDLAIHQRLIAAVTVSPTDVATYDTPPISDPDIYPHTNDKRFLSALSSDERRFAITPAILAKRWGIGLVAAQSTLQNTTQTGVRNVFISSERKVRKKAPWLKFPAIKGKFYADQMFSKLTSVHGHTGATIYTNGLGYDRIYPWKKKADHADTIMDFIHDVGVPQILVTDNAPEEVLGRAKETCRTYRISQQVSVPYSPWQNLAEASIREMKKAVRRAIRITATPPRLWSYCAVWCTAVRRLTSNSIRQLDGRVPEEYVTGSTPDISPYVLFDWYQPVYYWTPTAEFPFEKKLIGRWVGVSENCVDEMAYTILTSAAKIIIRKSVWGLSEDDMRNPAITDRIAALDKSIHALIHDQTNTTLPLPPADLFNEDDDDVVDPVDPLKSSLEIDDYTPEELDEYLTAELLLPRGGETVRARVLKRTRDGDGIPIGRRNSNPILDSRQYQVEFPDGSLDTFTANVIAENLYSQVDSEGRPYQIFKAITDHRSDDRALSIDMAYYTDKHGHSRPRQTTVGWDLQVEWADGTTSWLPLKDLKDSNPIETAEYAIGNNLADEPAFLWWVRKVLRQQVSVP